MVEQPGRQEHPKQRQFVFIECLLFRRLSHYAMEVMTKCSGASRQIKKECSAYVLSNVLSMQVILNVRIKECSGIEQRPERRAPPMDRQEQQ